MCPRHLNIDVQKKEAEFSFASFFCVVFAYLFCILILNRNIQKEE